MIIYEEKDGKVKALLERERERERSGSLRSQKR